MTKTNLQAGVALLIVMSTVAVPQNCFADVISPHIKETTSLFPEVKADKAFYGTGVAGRMTEASELRFRGEQETADGDYDNAIRKLAKAVQLDPGDPTGHLLFARALSRKIRSGKDVTPKLVQVALAEWKLLWHHDADQTEQVEAKMEALRLGRIAKALNKRLKQQEKMGVHDQVAQTSSANNNQ